LSGNDGQQIKKTVSKFENPKKLIRFRTGNIFLLCEMPSASGLLS
jgi:hypothetical protein